MTMKKGPSPALVTTALLGGSTVVLGTSTAVTALLTFVPTVLTSLGTTIAGTLATVLGIVSAPLTSSIMPFLTPGLDFGAGLTRGLQDALTGGDLLTEILSGIGSGGTTAIVAAPTVAPCPFC